jgi:hypothetical protein
MFERLFYDPQARADARQGLGEVGRGIVSLLKWAAIIALGLVVLAALVALGLIYNDWAKAHETSIRWALAGGAAGYGLWLLAQIRDQLAKLVAILEVASRQP